MTEVDLLILYSEQIKIAEAAALVLKDSYDRVKTILDSGRTSFTVTEKESCEALTSRFSRLCDFEFQRLFRTIDRIELSDEGSAIDRLNRMEKRGIIQSAAEWRVLRELRNQNAHEYLIEASLAKGALIQSFAKTPVLFETLNRIKSYMGKKEPPL